MRKSLLICVLLYSICTLVSAQSVRTRPVLQTTEQPEVSRYDTTTMYLSLRKLKKDIHYYDGQTIMYLPDINPNKPYAYYDMFFRIKFFLVAETVSRGFLTASVASG